MMRNQTFRHHRHADRIAADDLHHAYLGRGFKIRAQQPDIDTLMQIDAVSNGNIKQQFISDLKQLGAQILEGGRFLHVSGLCDKGQALQWLTEVYNQSTTEPTLKTLAIGDSQNDLAMLEKADYALIIRSPVHGLPAVERKHNLYISTHTGPKGWAEGVNKIIDATLHSDSSNLPRGNHG